MNPAMLAYLQQAQQNSPQMQQGIPEQVGLGYPPSQMEDAQRYGEEYYRNPQSNPQEETSDAVYNPFKNGAQAAIRASKESRRMDPEEENRAMGKALMAFSSRMAQPTGQEGFGGTLQAINNSFNPAYAAYEQEQQRVAHENAQMMNEYERQQYLQQVQQQKAQQHLQDIMEKRRQHEENLQYKREKEYALQGHRAALLGQDRNYKASKLDLEEKKILGKIEQSARQGKPVPPSVINNLHKDLEHLSAAELEYQNYEEARKLLEGDEVQQEKKGKRKESSGSPLYNPYGYGALSKFGVLPEAWKTPEQARFEELSSDLTGQIFKRFKYRNQAEFKNIKTIDPYKSKGANLNIIKQSQKRLLPLLEKKKRLEQLYERVQSGQGIPEEENISSLTPSVSEQNFVRVQDPEGGMHEIPSHNLQQAIQEGFTPL